MTEWKPRVWVTRTCPSAFDSAAQWIAAGATIFMSPLLSVQRVSPAPPCPPAGSTLIFTSRNGVDAFSASHQARDFDVVTVGDATAAQASQAGFQTVTSAQGTSRDVVDLILRRPNDDRRITHCSGRHVRGTISEDLTAAGRHAVRDMYYGSTLVADWPCITSDDITHVALYSPLAAKTFAQLARHRNLSNLTAISISAATDRALDGLNLRRRDVATTPDEPAMLALL